MFSLSKEDNIEKNYVLMVNTIKEMIKDEDDIIANLANVSAVINLYMAKINWVGFYIFKDGDLVLGPFQGLPACIRIKPTRGVCGKAFTDRETVIVDNVHEFPGHIACDANSKSEIVLPIIKNGEVFGVLDIDSPNFNRFTELERKYLEQVVELL